MYDRGTSGMVGSGRKCPVCVQLKAVASVGALDEWDLGSTCRLSYFKKTLTPHILSLKIGMSPVDLRNVAKMYKNVEVFSDD